jgi:hypothetical protein
MATETAAGGRNLRVIEWFTIGDVLCRSEQLPS